VARNFRRESGIASDLAKQPEPGLMAYGACKAALLHVTKNLAKEYAPKIRVNAVSPGPVWTRRCFQARRTALTKREELLQAMAHGSAAAWGHLNLLGEYDFSEDKLQDSVGIKPPKLTD
jgi:NAD(P)-dependent dehydrogenase (short-subunit alcohol dehydrogenase family)